MMTRSSRKAARSNSKQQEAPAAEAEVVFMLLKKVLLHTEERD